MNQRLITEINNRCKFDDILVSVGDFVLYGKERGIENTRTKSLVYEDTINAKVVHVLGNHDLNNSVKGYIFGAYMKIGKRKAWVQHYPPWYDDYKAPTNADLYLCGHVHDKWTYRTYNDKLVINVGVDSQIAQYRPVSVKQIVKTLDKFSNKTLQI